MSIKGDALSPADVLQITVVDQLANDAQLSTILGAGVASQVFASQAPAETLLPYVVLTVPSESARNTFDKWGNETSVRFDVWTDDTQYRNTQGIAIYKHIKRIFQGKAIALDATHHLISCVVDLVLDLVDQDGKSHHTIVELRARTQQVGS